MELNTVVCGHNVDVLNRMKENSIDLTVTSPPYDNLRNYKGYSFDFEGLAKQLHRVTKIGGVVVWVVNDATIDGDETGTSFKQALYFKKIGFKLHDTMIYAKEPLTLNHNRYEQNFEYMFIFSKGKPKTFNSIRMPCKWYGKGGDRTGQKFKIHNEKNCRVESGRNRNNIKSTKIKGNIWKYNVGSMHSSTDKIAFKHTAIFPEELAKDHILSWSNENDVVLDPFCGSGTTLKMAKIHNRNFIGVDCSEEYCELSRERVKIADKIVEENNINKNVENKFNSWFD